MKGRLTAPRSVNLVPAMERLAERCRALALPLWHWDPDGTLLIEPREPGVAAAWLRATASVFHIDTAARAAPAGAPDRAPAAELFDGCWLLALGDATGRGRAGVTACLALSEAALCAPAFETVCAAASIDPHEARGACRSLARHRRDDLASLHTAVAWTRADLIQAARDRTAIDDFGTQLSQMYEEIGLLYRLGRCMNRITVPVEFVETTCRELAETLPFGWVAATFDTSSLVAENLAGRMILAGTPPCPREEFDRLTAALIGQLAPDRWTLLPDGPQSPPAGSAATRGGAGAALAAAVGAQVLAHPISRDGQVIGALMAGNKAGDDPEVSSFETQLLDAAADFLAVFVENAGLYDDQRALFVGMIEAITASIDAKDRYTCGHSERVAYLASTLALESGLDPAAAERVRLAGLLHDVGKIGVPEAVLCKRDRLTDEEFEHIKRHPAIGHRILKDIPFIDDVLPGVLYHHERWDGRGYPERIAAEEIPLVARFLAVADSFDAMSSNRAYRSAMPRPTVLAEIARCAGSQFDPALAHRFVHLDFSEYDAMVQRHQTREREAA